MCVSVWYLKGLLLLSLSLSLSNELRLVRIEATWELAGFLENVVKMTKKKVYGRWGGGVWVRGAKRIKVGLVWYVGNVE